MRSIKNINLKPFATLQDDLLYQPALRVMVYNVLAFIPIGFLVSCIVNHRYQYLIVIASGIFLSFTYEFAQAITMLGIGDIDDVILNGLGTLIGYQFFRYASAIYRGIKNIRYVQ